VDLDFPLHLWDRLLPQAEMTLNLLRKSRQHPQLSAAAHYHGMVDYNKIAFSPPGCKIIAHEKPSQWQTWAPHGQHDYSLGPAIHHYSCQMFYISSTASERIVDTLEFYPNNSPMPQLSSTERLLMAANGISDALKHPHPEVPFAQVGDDTITGLAQLENIFKNKFQKPSAPELIQAPLNAAGNKHPAVLADPILTPPMQHKYQTRSHRTISLNTARNTLLLPRVVTPMTGQAASLGVPARRQNLPPRNSLQDDLWNMETDNQAIELGTNHWTNQHFAHAESHPVTGKEIEYMALIKVPDLQPLWKRGFGNEAGRLFQGIRHIQSTNTCFFVELKNIPKDRQITYGKIGCDYKPHKKEKERVRLTLDDARLDYSGDMAAPTADITSFNFLINSTLSTTDAEMMMMDIKNYYLGTPLPSYEKCACYYQYFLKKL
jgi:hypothetical protein